MNSFGLSALARRYGPLLMVAGTTSGIAFYLYK
jgi:hypothetical protein